MYRYSPSWRSFRFFFFKHKTAYEIRISAWSSDVCSSDLVEVKLEVPVAKSTDKLASAYPIESCKAAIALIMDRDPKIIQGRKLADGQVHVSYRRPDDGKKWEARCEMVDDSHLQWAAFNAFGDGQMGQIGRAHV